MIEHKIFSLKYIYELNILNKFNFFSYSAETIYSWERLKWVKNNNDKDISLYNLVNVYFNLKNLDNYSNAGIYSGQNVIKTTMIMILVWKIYSIIHKRGLYVWPCQTMLNLFLEYFVIVTKLVCHIDCNWVFSICDLVPDIAKLNMKKWNTTKYDFTNSSSWL